MTELPREAARAAKGAGVVFPVLAGLFWLTTPLGPWDALYLTFLLVVLPVLAVAQLPLVELDEPLPRIPVYLSSGALILGVGWLAVVVGGRSLGDQAMGLGETPLAVVGIWAGGLVLGAVALVLGFYALRRLAGVRETPILRELIPRTLGEKSVFLPLSLAAGVGEELAYRGYLIPTLAGLLGSVWPAALLSSAVFGILHAYQGWLGVARTGALGLMFALSFIVSGTLLPAIVAHAILDILAGLVLGDTLLNE
jgi:membrane protease YdiL (CAAX protease family)